jgi:hypothetical protein
MRITSAALAACLACVLVACASISRSDAGDLRTELLAMETQDQALRTAEPIDVPAIIAADAAHTARMKAIVAQHGWPTIAQVGQDGAAAAWLLVQHADADPDFQRAILEQLRPLLATGEVQPKHFAYLWDRTHAPQKYGTQGTCAGKGDWRPNPIEDADQVDAARASMQLGTMAEYIAMVSTVCKGDPAPGPGK